MGNGGQNFERRQPQSMGAGGGNSNMGGAGNMNSGNDMFSRRGQQPGGGQNRNQNSGGFGGSDGGFGGPQNFNQGMNR